MTHAARLTMFGSVIWTDHVWFLWRSHSFVSQRGDQALTAMQAWVVRNCQARNMQDKIWCRRLHKLGSNLMEMLVSNLRQSDRDQLNAFSWRLVYIWNSIKKIHSCESNLVASLLQLCERVHYRLVMLTPPCSQTRCIPDTCAQHHLAMIESWFSSSVADIETVDN